MSEHRGSSRPSRLEASRRNLCRVRTRALHAALHPSADLGTNCLCLRPRCLSASRRRNSLSRRRSHEMQRIRRRSSCAQSATWASMRWGPVQILVAFRCAPRASAPGSGRPGPLGHSGPPSRIGSLPFLETLVVLIEEDSDNHRVGNRNPLVLMMQSPTPLLYVNCALEP